MEKLFEQTFRVFLVCIVLMSCTLAEARIGGGRSSGFRGSRGFSSPSYSQPTSPSRNYSRGYQQPYNTPPSYPGAPAQMGWGGFGRGLMGGLAGGMLSSMLFRSFGYAGNGMGGGGGGFGLLEILLLAGIGYFIFRKFTASNPSKKPYEMTSYERLRSVEPGPYASQGPAANLSGNQLSEEQNISILRSSDSSFEITAFKDERMDDFLRLQAAWNKRDLTSVADLIGLELKHELEADIADLKSRRQINKIENIAVRASTLKETWQERGAEYATLHFRANVTDYTIDESTGELIGGDRELPVKFEEDWTFVRRLNDSNQSNRWKLTAIEN